MPMIVATIVATSAISRLLTSALLRSGRLKTSAQCLSVNPSQVKLYFPAGLLKENAMMTAIGISRYAIAKPA